MTHCLWRHAGYGRKAVRIFRTSCIRRWPANKSVKDHISMSRSGMEKTKETAPTEAVGVPLMLARIAKRKFLEKTLTLDSPPGHRLELGSLTMTTLRSLT